MFGIPTLHCILGPCNRLYHYLEENCEAVNQFSKKLGIVRDPFNNKDYNGNYCEKILKNLDDLQQIVEPKFSPFIETLRALHDVKEACFKPILKPNWRETITRFKNGWCDLFMDFEIGFSNKVHIIIEHIPQVIERTGRSLHLSSEQVVEAAHAKFDKVWQRYKVTSKATVNDARYKVKVKVIIKVNIKIKVKVKVINLIYTF